jgi:anaerobic magnesium-protoporphyrin IX monomethyl ester cyclase
MNILLVNPPKENAIKIPGVSQIILEEHNYSPPLGLMYVESYLKNISDIKVKIFNFQSPGNPSLNDFKKELLGFQPRIVGITAMTLFWYDVLQTAKIVKGIIPNSMVVIGGNHIYVYPEETLLHKEIDVIVHGEGEVTFSELVKNIQSGKELEEIQGIWYKFNGQIIKNPPRKKESNLDQFPFPDHKNFNFQKYRVSIEKNVPSAVLISSRGCPYYCTFCMNNDHTYRTRNAENIVDEILECKKAGYRSISFYDDNFNQLPEHVEELCRAMIKRKTDMPWNCRVRADGLNKELMQLMAQAGCQRLHVGVESGSQHILNSIKKGVTIEQIKRVFNLAREIGISTLAYVIIGFPSEKKDDIKKTIDFLFEINSNHLHCTPLIPMPGTKIYGEAINDPSFGGDYLKEYVLNPYPNLIQKMWMDKVSEKYILSTIRNLYIKFYFQPKHIYDNISDCSGIKDFLIKANIAIQLLSNYK